MASLLDRLGVVVRRLREQQGLSVADVAEHSGLSSRFVTEIQAGRGNVSIVRLASLARALGTTAGRLVSDAENGADEGTRIVALLGIRGAGKSTIGPKLAARLGVEFLELDRLVEAEAGMAIGEIFATHGEEYFHRLEVSALRRFGPDRRLAHRRSPFLSSPGMGRNLPRRSRAVLRSPASGGRP